MSAGCDGPKKEVGLSNVAFFVPKALLGILLLHWISFLYGIISHCIETIGNPFDISLLTFISPPNKQLWFQSVDVWPHCSDMRFHLNKLFTHQLVHGGLSHLIPNHCHLLVVGSLLEHRVGAVALVSVYAYGIVLGALGHGIIWPFRPLIGCSHGNCPFNYCVFIACCEYAHPQEAML